ncbi:MAG: Rrf2 family transcriptional regulator [Planctomycetes bacterium]|nr:Rrf2 family transcriptional regulator [Planctomycetota bacterium]
MKLSTRTEYGIRAVLELAGNVGNGPLQLKIIAQRQNISIKYLEQLMAILRASGYVRSIRGSRGGYIIGKPANQIKISEVFRTLEGPITTSECIDNEDYCPNTKDCVMRELWCRVQKSMMDVLESVTLQDLIDKAGDSKRLTYEI